MGALPEWLTIGDLAQRSGVATSALRFYESKGLLHAERTPGNQRRFHRSALRRIGVIRAAQANLSSVFLLYEDREQALARELAPAFEGGGALEVPDASGAVHTLARVDDPALIESVQARIAERPLVIADGHHRYETALAYRDECRAGAVS